MYHNYILLIITDVEAKISDGIYIEVEFCLKN